MAQADSGDNQLYDKPYDHCIACSSEQIGRWRSKSFAYSTGMSGVHFDIYRCRACGTGFLNPPPHDSLLKQVYTYSGHGLSAPADPAEIVERERRFPNSMVDAERIIRTTQRLLKSATKNALDVGSGYGFFTKKLVEHGYRVTSINPGKYENEVFKEMLGYEPISAYFDDFSTDARFDIVLMSQVLEHMKSPLEAIKKVSELLCEGGVFACAVPNFNSFSVKIRGTGDNGCLWIPEHVNYFTKMGLSRLIASCGLKVVHCDFVTRIPCDALSKRLGLAESKLLQYRVRFGQKPFAKLVDKLGYGLYINVYAVRN